MDVNYSSFKLGLLALKWAIAEKFKDYLVGAKFIVYTDNNPIAHLQSAKLGAEELRWVVQLASFDFEVKYRARRENTNTDAFSRFPAADPLQVNTTNNGVEVTLATVGQEDDSKQRMLSAGAAKLLRQYKRLCVHEEVLCRRLTDPNIQEQ